MYVYEEFYQGNAANWTFLNIWIWSRFTVEFRVDVPISPAWSIPLPLSPVPMAPINGDG